QASSFHVAKDRQSFYDTPRAMKDQGRESIKKPAREDRMVGQTGLVTGAGGFIGSHLVERLVRDGHRVRVLVRYNGRDDRGHPERIEGEAHAAKEERPT